GDNPNPPARVINNVTGLVENQTSGGFALSSDHLDQLYQVDSNNNASSFYMDDAGAINTGKLTKVATANQISLNKTGWVNASSPHVADGGVWLPYTPGTTYDEGNGTYKSMSIWGKRTFLSPAVTGSESLSISSNDDAYLYVNGFNVKSTAYARTGLGGGPISMIDNSSYSVGDFVVINGQTGRIVSKPGGPGSNKIQVPGISLPDIGDFGSPGLTPYTVYHADAALDSSLNPITLTSTATNTNTISVASTNNLYSGETIYIGTQQLIITSFIPGTSVTFNAPVNAPSGTVLITAIRDGDPASNTNAPVSPAVNTGVLSAVSNFDVSHLLRNPGGFNTIGFKATEDKGINEGIKINATGITAIGDTKSPTGGVTGIDTDNRWAVQLAPDGYDGSISYNNVNDPANPLSQAQIVDLFDTDKTPKKQIAVNFINQDQNGNGILSKIATIDVSVTGEPLIRTYKTTNYSTESLLDGLVTTQLSNGYVDGKKQDGAGAGLTFSPTGLVSIPANKAGLNYTTGLDGKAIVNVFINGDDNIVNDASVRVKVGYYEDTDQNGIIDTTESSFASIKYRYIGLQDLRNDTGVNPLSTVANAADVTGPLAVNKVADRFTTATALGGTSTVNSVTGLSNTTGFRVGDYVSVSAGTNKQSMQIASIVPGTSVTFTQSLHTTMQSLGSVVVSTDNLLSNVTYAAADTVYNNYLVAGKGRSGGSDVNGNTNPVTTKLKALLDSDDFQELLRYNLLDNIYLAATANDSRGDQIVGKLVLDWDWRRRRVAVKQGSFSAIYKS
ncbi:MAG: hypothetical protein H7263_13265, partial [Candidatus Sericytochromatia bacterium]|nr:hypothetical protein [Candidatus Sericytochromatia bacterium]